MNKSINSEKLWFLIFLLGGIIVQVATYLWEPTNPLSLVSGIFGIVAVVLCARGNILTYIFGFIQILTYSYLCYLERFYAGIATNVFYFLCQIYGSYNWYRRLSGRDTFSITTKEISRKLLLVLLISMLVVSILTGVGLYYFSDDTQPFLDAFTTIPAIIAELMMIMAIKEHWYFWFFIDVLLIIMWIRAGNYCMVMQYLFWCINCLYGFIQWKKAMAKTS